MGRRSGWLLPTDRPSAWAPALRSGQGSTSAEQQSTLERRSRWEERTSRWGPASTSERRSPWPSAGRLASEQMSRWAAPVRAGWTWGTAMVSPMDLRRSAVESPWVSGSESAVRPCPRMGSNQAGAIGPCRPPRPTRRRPSVVGAKADRRPSRLQTGGSQGIAPSPPSLCCRPSCKQRQKRRQYRRRAGPAVCSVLSIGCLSQPAQLSQWRPRLGTRRVLTVG
jgi:hypothetical protein